MEFNPISIELLCKQKCVEEATNIIKERTRYKSSFWEYLEREIAECIRHSPPGDSPILYMVKVTLLSTKDSSLSA